MESGQKAELEKQTEALKEASMQLQQAGSQGGGVQQNNNGNQGGFNQLTDMNQSAADPVVNNGSITGYSQSNYANNVVAGSRGYYVTVGVYGQMANAERMATNLSKRGIASRIFQDRNNNMYYVFLMKFANYDAADQAKSTGLNGQYNGRLWIKIVK